MAAAASRALLNAARAVGAARARVAVPRVAPAVLARAARAAAVAVAAGAVLGGAGVAMSKSAPAPLADKPKILPAEKYQEIYNAIAKKLENLDYDDGSYGPVLVRLAWHAAGTYDAATKTGGSNGATMRFKPEAGHGANAGLKLARDLLEPIKQAYPDISYSDLWSLAGVAAIQEMGGPTITWRPGRVDAVSETACTPDGRLPDATKGSDHLRSIFGRMGFNDQEIVALSGAHALGRCHTDRSGFSGPWTRAPTTFSNEYFRLLLDEQWVEKKWSGPRQFVDAKTGELMMLPTDLVLIQDPSFKSTAKVYASDSAAFFRDFEAAFRKLLELGVPFPANAPQLKLKRTA